MKSNPEQWQRIYQLFGEVVGLPSHERAAVLLQTSDDHMRQEVEELLIANDEAVADTAFLNTPDGPFGDHLRRIAASLEQDKDLREVVRGILQNQPCPTPESFYRLRSAGLIVGDSAREVRLRCQLYATYLAKRLL